MADKLKFESYPRSLSEGGFVVPTDYVFVKPTFRRQLMDRLTHELPAGSHVLDLNAGTAGPGADLVRAGHRYTALEPNAAVRDALASQGLTARAWRPPWIPHDDGSVRLVVALAFLEHLPTWLDALQQLLEVRRVLEPGGRCLIVAPNAPGMGRTFWDDYKHGWYVSRKRIADMAGDAGLVVRWTRYTVGWATMAGGVAGAAARVAARSVMAALNLSPVGRLTEAVGLEPTAARVRKTIFELVAVELGKPR